VVLTKRRDNMDAPDKQMCEDNGVKQEDLEFVPTKSGTSRSDCPNCFFDPNNDGACTYSSSDCRCAPGYRSDRKSGYWVLRVDKPSIALCKEIGVEQEYVKFVEHASQCSDACDRCCFKDVHTSLCRDAKCEGRTRRDRKEGYWVLKTEPMTLEAAEKKIEELKRFIAEKREPVVGQVYRHESGDLYLVVFEGTDRTRTRLFRIKGKHHTYYSSSSLGFAGMREMFTLVGDIKDML
jgi:hypothetical protein